MLKKSYNQTHPPSKQVTLHQEIFSSVPWENAHPFLDKFYSLSTEQIFKSREERKLQNT